jgi:hypothetical protein
VSGGKLRRGFKSRCDEIVAEVRAEMRLTRYDPFDPFAYARKLRVPCEPVSALALHGCSVEALAHVAGRGRADFSATTVYRGTRRLILYNGHNSPERQRSDVSHELAHVLLEHEPGPVVGLGGCRVWDDEQEGEAGWLGGVLLVPKHVALALARKGSPERDAAARYGVSVEMMRWRLNMSGALKRARRERKTFVR